MDMPPRALPSTSLDVERLRAGSASLTIGSDLRYVEAVDSTNRLARDLPPGAWRHGTAIITDYQRAGRGRRERRWLAPPRSSLLVSVLLDPVPGSLPGDMVMIAALAVADAVQDVTGLRCEIKWPNDVLVGGRKLCGILSEYARQAEKARVILGIGINVNVDPEALNGIDGSATSLWRETGAPVERETLALALFKRLDLWYLDLTRGPDAVFSVWASRLSEIGHCASVFDTGGTWQGLVTGVRRDGGLLVRDDHGKVRTVFAADVTVRHTPALQPFQRSVE